MTQASANLSRMMNEGRSFSGRERHCIFLNTGGDSAAAGRFSNISAVSGLDFPDDGRAVAVVDWDTDGRQDVWISNRNAPRLRLMRNEQAGGNHYVALRLEGDGTTTNRDAIGARVEVVVKGKAPGIRGQDAANLQSAIGVSASAGHPKSIKTLRAGEGFLAQSSKWLHFGLGAADAVEKVLVRWPGGSTEEFAGMEVDRRYRLVQGTGAADEATRPQGEVQLVASAQTVLPDSSIARIPMIETLTVPPWSYEDSQGAAQRVATEPNGATLINLWSSSCVPCLKELSEFAERYDEIQAAGIEILALSVDGLGREASVGDSLAEAVFKFKNKYPFPVGKASAVMVQDLQYLHDLQFALHHPLPLPSSFLLDGQGRLAVIYKGPVSVDGLLQDPAHSKRSRLERIVQSAPLAGRLVAHPRVRQIAENQAVTLRFLLAQYLTRNGRPDEAVTQFEDMLQIQPDSVLAHNNLGNALLAAGRPADAVVHYEAAFKIDPDVAEVQVNWGNALQALGRPAKALPHYAEAVRIQPDRAEAHYNWGNALHAVGRPDEAIERFREAVRLKPDYANAHHNLGYLYAAQSRYEDALKHFEISVQLAPDNKQFRENLDNVRAAVSGTASPRAAVDSTETNGD